MEIREVTIPAGYDASFRARARDATAPESGGGRSAKWRIVERGRRRQSP
jgi:hypothetical protein